MKKEKVQKEINLLDDSHLIDENLLKVEDNTFKKFDRLEFYKKNNIQHLTTEQQEGMTLDLAKEEMKKITNVVDGTGFAYFFLEYCRVSHPTRGSIVIKDDAYKWQVNAAVDFLKNRYIVSLKSRQVAFSTTVGAYALWRALFFDSQRIVVISKNQRDSTTFLERIKFIYEHLPVWLKQATSEFAKTSVTFAHNFSKITSLPNKGDPAQGESLSLLITDEFASYQDSQAILSAATPALSAGALTEFSNDCLPSQFFVISTLPRKNVVNNDYLRILHGAQDNPNSKFKLIEVEVDDIPHYRSKSWHLEMLETLGTRGYKIEVCKQEVYETEHSLIEGYILQGLETKNPIRVDFLNPEDVTQEGYYKDLNTFIKMKNNWDPEYKYLKGLWIWEDPDPEQEYCIVADVAGGEADDYCAFHVFDLTTNTQVAEYKGKVNTEQYKEVLLTICEHYNNAKLSVERNGLGINVCQYFGDTINYENFYWHQKTKKTFVSGFPMYEPIRSHCIAFLENYLTKKEIHIQSIRTVNELRNFGMTSRGKIKAISGNDDLVMALCQFCYLQQINWAVSDNMMINDNLLGMSFDEEEEKEGKKSYKYWEDEFDLSERDQETLRIARATGSSVNINELDI